MSSTTPEFKEHPYGWVVVGVATMCLAVGFGANLTVSVFIEPFQREFGWPRADISFAYTVLTIGAALGGIFWGTLSDRIGAKTIAFIGVFSLSAGLAGLSFQNQLWAVYAIYFFMGAVGFSGLFAPLLALTGLWFSKNKGIALGIVTAGGAIGQGIIPFIVRLLITNYDWRTAALYLGISYLVVLVPLLFLLKPPPVLTEHEVEVSRSNKNLWNISHKISVPWLALAGIFCCICMAVPLIHLVPLGIDLKLSPDLAAGLLLVLMVSGMFGRLFFGWLADRIGGLFAYFIASVGQTSVVFWFTQTDHLGLLTVFAIVFGFGFAGVMTGLIICAREAAPLRIAGFAVAAVTTTAWIGMGVGGFFGGYLYDMTDNYVSAYGMAAAAGVTNMIIVGTLIWYRFGRVGRLAAA